jgi:hypothetical protein
MGKKRAICFEITRQPQNFAQMKGFTGEPSHDAFF